MTWEREGGREGGKAYLGMSDQEVYVPVAHCFFHQQSQV